MSSDSWNTSRGCFSVASGAFEAATAEGTAVTFQGKLIDYAMAARARRVLALAEVVGG